MWDMVILDECFPYGQKVTTNEGEMCIGEIVEHRRDLFVLSCNFLTNELEWRRVTGHKKIKRYNRLVRVHHERGQIDCTENHLLWTQRGYVQAARLAAGDELRVVTDRYKLARTFIFLRPIRP